MGHLLAIFVIEKHSGWYILQQDLDQCDLKIGHFLGNSYKEDIFSRQQDFERCNLELDIFSNFLFMKNFQAGIFYNKTLNEAERFRLADNIASHLCNAQGFIQVTLHSDPIPRIALLVSCYVYMAFIFIITICVDMI